MYDIGDAGERSCFEVLRNSLIQSDLPFRDFVELALYHPEFGYYARPESPMGREGDFITSPLLSPVFSYVSAISSTNYEPLLATACRRWWTLGAGMAG